MTPSTSMPADSVLCSRPCNDYKGLLVGMETIEVYDMDGVRLLTAEVVAELAGCKVATLDAYLSRGQMPSPVGIVGRTRLWSEPTVRQWLATRGPDVIPAELRALPRWMRHKAKRPLTVTGRSGSSTDPSKWSTYAAVRASNAGDGFGFTLNGDGVVGVDLDHCVTDGVVSTAARSILRHLPGTYAELSPSGTGVRLFAHADVVRGRRLTVDGVAFEVYPTSRFLTVTGNRLPCRPSTLADLGPALLNLLER